MSDTYLDENRTSEFGNTKVAMNSPDRERLPLVTACRRRDLPILALLADCAPAFLGASEIHVITHRSNFDAAQKLPLSVKFHDQDGMIPGMTLESLRHRADLPEMPLAAGWYLQQFLKLAISERFPGWTRYLIWDADTLPLRPIETFDGTGRMIFTTADEWHEPYFKSIVHLLGVSTVRRVSFVAQHLPIRVDLLHEMQSVIHSRFPGDTHWAWKIMENLPGTGHSRFSEYETFAHYCLATHSEQCVIRKLPWTREGGREVGMRPTKNDLQCLSDKYAFAAFEANHSPWRQLAQWMYIRLPEVLRRLVRRGA